MADEKISAMTDATEVGNADVVPIVQGGSNKKATRALFLTADTGEDITLSGNSLNAPAIVIRNGGNIDIISAGSTFVSINTNGTLTLVGGGLSPILFGAPLPTSDPGIQGALWNNLGIVNISL